MNFLHKYDIPVPPKPSLTDWLDSVPVILLFDYVIQNQKYGVTLAHGINHVSIIMKPGIGKKELNGKRWKIVENCRRLLEDAREDLTELINNNKFNLKNIHGSFHDLSRHG